MNVLIYGAANVIAIGLARVLENNGHRVLFSDTQIFARAFLSKYCRGKYIFTDPASDKEAFAKGVSRCIAEEKINLVVPTTDKALLDLVEADDAIPRCVRRPFPRDAGKIRYVMDKGNIPQICRSAGVLTPQTLRAGNAGGEALGNMQFPLVVKKAVGVAGEGFAKVEDRPTLARALSRSAVKSPGEGLLIQEYVHGKVYGAGGIFDGNRTGHFYSYEYLNRYPRGSGSATRCLLHNLDVLRMAFDKIMATLGWQGYCQMDFVLDAQTGNPYLLDINPVHWYTMPFSADEELCCLFHYLAPERQASFAGVNEAPYATLCLTRELQRFLSCPKRYAGSRGEALGLFSHLHDLRRTDFYWDPWPILLAPVLKLLRWYHGSRR